MHSSKVTMYVMLCPGGPDVIGSSPRPSATLKMGASRKRALSRSPLDSFDIESLTRSSEGSLQLRLSAGHSSPGLARSSGSYGHLSAGRRQFFICFTDDTA